MHACRRRRRRRSRFSDQEQSRANQLLARTRTRKWTREQRGVGKGPCNPRPGKASRAQPFVAWREWEGGREGGRDGERKRGEAMELKGEKEGNGRETERRE